MTGYDETPGADLNREAKVQKIALHAWRYAVTPQEIDALDEHELAMLARRAETHPPHEGSPTWQIVKDRLALMWANADDPRAPIQDRITEPRPWAPTRRRTPAPQPVEPAPVPEAPRDTDERHETSDDPPSEANEPVDGQRRDHDTVGQPTHERTFVALEPPVIPDDAPRGWAELAALGPLTWPGAPKCVRCPRAAIVVSVEGPRCAEHPPNWGRTLNWTPSPLSSCTSTRCYCGRHPSAMRLVESPQLRAPKEATGERPSTSKGAPRRHWTR